MVPDPGAAPPRRMLLACGSAPLLFLLLILVQGAFRPGYDASNRWGSELSNGDWGWVQIANFVVTGLLTIAFAVGVRTATGGGPGAKAIPWLTGVFGAGLIVAGVFRADPDAGFPPGSTPPAEPTVHGWIHDLNLFPTWAALTAAILCAAYRATRCREGVAWILFTVAAGVLTPATMYVAAQHFDMDTLTGTGHGLWQRVSQAAAFGWYAAYTARLLRATRAARTGTSGPQVDVPAR